MVTVSDFILGAAEDMSLGNFARAAARFRFPARVLVGSREMQLNNPFEAEDMLRTYRKNLDVECYARSDVMILHVTEETSMRVQALIRWVNLNTRGAVISTADTSWLMERDAEGGLGIILTEILREPINRHIDGLSFR